MAKPVRLLAIGDGINKTTGFGRVMREILGRLSLGRYEIAQIASLDTAPFCDSRPYYDLGITPFFPGPTDPTGMELLGIVLGRFTPDVVLYVGDAGTGIYWLKYLRELLPAVPIVAYAPVEGAPIGTVLLPFWREVDYPITFTQWAAARVAEALGAEDPIPWVYHGCDAEEFAPISAEWRAESRHRRGWVGAYVVAYVARNMGRKAQDRLLRAAAILINSGAMPDLRLYLHCRPFDGGWGGGWALDQLARWYGIDHAVSFAPTDDPTQGVGAEALREVYGSADLYVHPAKIEGFGLPLLEAMAAGLPVVHTDDHGGNMTEVAGACVMGRLEPIDIEIRDDGAELFTVSPTTIATAIRTVRAAPFETWARVREQGMARAAAFEWRRTAAVVGHYIEQAAAGGRAPERTEIPAHLAAVGAP